MPGQNTKRAANPNLRPPWQPGQSGNPGGRPKGLASYIREQTLEGRELADWLLNLIRQPTGIPLPVRFDAVRELMDRGFGKPVQATEVTGAEGAPLELGVREIVVTLPARPAASASTPAKVEPT